MKLYIGLVVFFSTIAIQAKDSVVYLTQSPQTERLGYGAANIEKNGEKMVIKHFIKNNYTVFDIGANKGEWSSTVLSLHSKAKIIAFEPIPAMVQQFKGNSALKSAKIFQLAISDKQSMLEFNYYPHKPTLSGLYERELVSTLLNSKPEKIKVQSISLDQFCFEHKIKHIHFLKIDTEGAEWAILTGASSLLQNKSIDAIQFEYGGAYTDSNSTLKNVYDLLTSKKYKIYRIASQGLIFIKHWDNKLENYTYSNYLAVRNK